MFCVSTTSVDAMSDLKLASAKYPSDPLVVAVSACERFGRSSLCALLGCVYSGRVVKITGAKQGGGKQIADHGRREEFASNSTKSNVVFIWRGKIGIVRPALERFRSNRKFVTAVCSQDTANHSERWRNSTPRRR